ncbi:MAG: ribonuclease D [Deltaproteobacteria bacterium]|nr:ribonuclease D [Deltaproteobacteria bacterium]HCH66897.1 ribonuclease D [Deltaproteobacteria bacterium]
MLITTSADLAEFCAAISDAPYICVDTEFLREKTYFAKLCLVQVAYGTHAAAIDPLSKGIDMSPLRDLLLDRSIVKVLHASTQDLEIFLDRLKEVPGPIFDTQIAASVCGLGEQPGYAKLVSSLLGIEVDKASQATDWSLRPLTQRQLDYALSDVTHLCQIYEKLLKTLDETGRAGWISGEMRALEEPTRYRPDRREAWRRVRIRHPKGRTLAVLRELAAWREQAAMQRNIPRKWVARDEVLVEIAQNLPKNPKDLARVRSLKPQVARGSDGAAMLAAMRAGLECPEADHPIPPAAKRRLSGHEPLVALLQALLRLRCEAHGVASAVVASRSELDRIATEAEPDVPALQGWRREIFGADALALCAGQLALTGRAGKVVDVPLSNTDSQAE